MKVYVASPGIEEVRARRVMQKVRNAGHEITFDWLGPEKKMRPHWRDHREEGRTHAEKEREGCRRASVLILLVPREKNKSRGLGCYIEYGIAAGVGRTLWIIDYQEYSRDSIFFCLPEVHFLTEREMEEALKMSRDTEIANAEELKARRAAAGIYSIDDLPEDYDERTWTRGLY